MAIAWLLNRTFVFPRFGCLCDRSEWPDIMPTCRLENSDLEFPFRCPLNFLLNVHFMQGVELPDARGRQGVPYREHSFLSNKRLSPSIRDSKVHVAFTATGAAAAANSADGAAAPTVAVPRGATDVELRAAAVDLRDGSRFSREETTRRVAAQLDTLIEKKVRHVVLSAFGCGAFRNPASEVAAVYAEEVGKRMDAFDVIAFGIFHAGYGPNNFAPFEAAFGAKAQPLGTS